MENMNLYCHKWLCLVLRLYTDFGEYLLHVMMHVIFYANSLNCSMICAVCYLNTMCVKMCICNVFVCYDMICVMCSISIITLLWCEDATILCVCKVLPWCDAMCVMICVLSCNNFVNTPWWCVLSYNFVNTPWVIVYSCKSHESPA